MIKILKKGPSRISFKEKVFAILILLLFLQLLGNIPTPFTNPDYVRTILGVDASLGLYNALTGRGFSNLSMMALSITPYITASIVLELLTVASTRISNIMTDKTSAGKKMRYLLQAGMSAALAFLQGCTMAYGYAKQGALTNSAWYIILFVALYWTLGTAISVWAGWLITEKILGKGLLNGTSLILLCNILSSYAGDAGSVVAAVRLYSKTTRGLICMAGIILCCIILLFCFVTYCQLSEKKIHLMQSKIVKGTTFGASTDFTVKLWPGSVIPIIFTAQLYSLPALFRSVSGAHWTWTGFFSTVAWFDINSFYYTIGAVGYIALIIYFSFYYANISLNLREIADNLKKSGHTIPGIRPGEPTVLYLKKQTHYVILLGGIALSIIALIPCIVSGVLHVQGIAFLGTSLLITVGVILDIRNYIVAQNRVRTYKKGGILHA